MGDFPQPTKMGLLGWWIVVLAMIVLWAVLWPLILGGWCFDWKERRRKEATGTQEKAQDLA